MSWARLVLDDGGNDRVGVLRPVQEDIVGGQSRAGELPELEVHVVVEPELAVGAGEVVPCFRGERQECLTQYLQGFRGVETWFARYVDS